MMENKTFTVLLIDDDRALRELLTEVLLDAGYHAVSYDNFKDALEFINNQSVDVIIVDLYFSNVFKEDLFTELSPVAMRIPVIVYTAYSSLQTAKQALQARFFAYLEKESSPEELLKVIQQAIHYKFKVEKEYLESIIIKRTQELEEEIQRRKENERQLRLSEEKYRLIVEAIPALVFLTDEKGNFLYLSPYINKVFKVDASKFTIDALVATLTQESYQKIYKYFNKFNQFKEKGTLFEVNEDISLYTRDGEKKYANLIVKPLFVDNKCLGFHGVLRDITAEVQSKLELQETLEELTSLYEAISDYIFILDKQFRIYRMNDPAKRFLEKHGINSEEIKFRTWGEAIQCKSHFLATDGCGTHEECAKCSIRTFLSKITTEGVRDQIDFAFKKTNGVEVFYFIAYGKLIRMQEGEFIFLSLTDITELHNAHEDLIRLNQQFKALVSNIQEGLLLLDVSTNRVLYVNDIFFKILEVGDQDVLNDPFCWVPKIIGKSDLTNEIDDFLRREDTKLTLSFEYLTGDHLKSISMNCIKMFKDRKSLMMFILTDVTLLKKDTLKDLRIWAEVELEERKKLARRIHDEINPIAGLLTSSCSFLDQVITEKHKELLDKHKKNLQFLQKSLYDLSHQLEERWEDFSFKEAIERYIDELMHNDVIQIHLNYEFEVDSLLYKKNLYAITMELIHNTLKYAHASNIIIELLAFENFVLYRYQDDGCGFDLEREKLKSHGLGLKHLEDRVREMAATMEFNTSPGKGVEVKIYLLKDA